MKAIEKIKEKRFSVEITFGSFYAQHSEVGLFATIEEAERFYKNSYITESEMNAASWSKEGEQPQFTIELRELKSLPQDIINELEELEEEGDFMDIYHIYSVRLKTKSYIFNKESVIFDWDSEEEIAEKETLKKWDLVEYEGSVYSTLCFSEKVVSLTDGSTSIMKGSIK